MNASVTSLPDRLARAETLILEASQEGIELLLLPELFNIGYSYDDSLFERAEGIHGDTTLFLEKMARKHHIMIGGSYLVRDKNDIFNRFMLFAPDGQRWQYDKNYPWGWERGYFKGDTNISIADTPIGRIGFLVCWDIAHTNLWKAYAGKVDLMLVSSCPPITTNPTYHLANCRIIPNKDIGRVALQVAKDSDARYVFTEGPKKLAECLGVPVISSSACGRIRTRMPQPKALWLTYCMVNPFMLKHAFNINDLSAEFDLADVAQIINASGDVLAECQRGQHDTWVQHTIDLNTNRQSGLAKIPKRLLPRFSYFLADTVFPLSSLSTYKKGLSKTLHSTEE